MSLAQRLKQIFNIDIKTRNNSFGQAHSCNRSVSVAFAFGVYKLVFFEQIKESRKKETE